MATTKKVHNWQHHFWNSDEPPSPFPMIAFFMMCFVEALLEEFKSKPKQEVHPVRNLRDLRKRRANPTKMPSLQGNLLGEGTKH